VIIPWLSAAFESLKTLIEWVLGIIVGLIALSVVGRLCLKTVRTTFDMAA
jgi:hypothetical protein